MSSVSSVLSPFFSYIILALMNITRNDMFHIKRRLSSSMAMKLGSSSGRRTERGDFAK